ncbi:hypothetical protein FRC09_013313 [Ceratobasidium sp. 395]|nr:hypothetical protein FRC09_013313 [Ceratobasidium sp. 395]
MFPEFASSRAMGIADILLPLFALMGTGDLASMLRVNRMFYDSALPFVWRKLPALNYLVELLTQDGVLTNEDEEICCGIEVNLASILSRANEEQKQKFKRHASMVRWLDLFDLPDPDHDREPELYVYRDFEGTEGLLPNLRGVTFKSPIRRVRASSIRGILRMCNVDTLTSVVISGQMVGPDNGEGLNVAWVFDTMSGISTRLRELTLATCYRRDLTSYPTLIAHLLNCSPDLETVTLNAWCLRQDERAGLAGLPQLRRLRVRERADHPRRLQSAPTMMAFLSQVSFDNLRSLELIGDWPSGPWANLADLSTLVVRLEQFGYKGGMNQPELEALMTLLGSYAKGLRSLKLALWRLGRLAPSTLLPIACLKLSELQLRGVTTGDPAGCLDAFAAWKSTLVELRAGQLMISLAQLSRFTEFPLLQSLTIRVSCWDGVPEPPSTAGLPCQRTLKLRVRLSPRAQAKQQVGQIASFLKSCWQDVTIVRPRWEKWDSEGESTESDQSEGKASVRPADALAAALRR